MALTIISLGGSIIAPDGVDSTFLSDFRKAIITYLDEEPEARLVFVAGGGAPARVYQKALREIKADADTAVQDWLGIKESIQ